MTEKGVDMITVFNRREVLATLNNKLYTKAIEALYAHEIDCASEITNLLGDNLSRGSYGRDNIGINYEHSSEYKIYVHKRDYDLAKFLIGGIKPC